MLSLSSAPLNQRRPRASILGRSLRAALRWRGPKRLGTISIRSMVFFPLGLKFLLRAWGTPHQRPPPPFCTFSGRCWVRGKDRKGVEIDEVSASENNLVWRQSDTGSHSTSAFFVRERGREGEQVVGVRRRLHTGGAARAPEGHTLSRSASVGACLPRCHGSAEPRLRKIVRLEPPAC